MNAEERLLPEGWTSSTLEQLGNWGSGGTPSRSIPTYYENGTIPWLVIGDLNDGLVIDAAQKITEEAVASSSAKIVPLNSVLIAMYGSIGKLGISGMRCATNQAIAHCVPDERLTSTRYLFYSLMNQKASLIAQGKGGAQQNISQTVLKAHYVPLAPLAEQKVIADKLDALLAQVDTLKARLDAIPAILKRFRQSVLSAAVTGKLTEEWRSDSSRCSYNTKKPNQVDLPEGFERLTKQSFKQSHVEHEQVELPTSWGISTIADLYDKNWLLDFADGNHGSLYPRKEEFGNSGALFLTASQMGSNWEVDLQSCPRLNVEKARLLIKGWSKPGDVLLSHNATVGRVGILPDVGEDVLLGTSVTFYRFNQEVIEPRFARILFSSLFFQHQLESVMAQTTRDQVPITKQVSLHFIYPDSVDEQTEIIHRVESLFAFADQIEARAQEATARVKHLTQSILAKAFRGELTEEWRKAHPELVSGENSAEALLERIRATRASDAPTASRGRRSRADASTPASANTPHLSAAEAPKRRGRPRKEPS